MNLRIGLIGSQGKMGQTITLCLKRDPRFLLAWSLTSTTPRDNLEKVDVIVDFSSTKALGDNLLLAKDLNVPIVIGTTGLDDQAFALFKNLAQTIPIFWSPNFSIGVAALTYATKILAPLLTPMFHLEIQETHHIHKKDSPSGTAIALAQAAALTNQKKPPIKSLREGEVIGEHELIFSSPDEELTLIHKSLSRNIFAKGALQAAAFLIGKPPALYNMENLLFSN